MNANNKRTTGSHYEQQVAAFLQKQGFEILEMNFRCKSGEIDIIARDGSYLVFVEVKYRRS
ncbi:MAG: YraN family protein, partial [Lachnospiraceae bacterium]|nr:YraN family protein [Lachnospiraceae bacterium]